MGKGQTPGRPFSVTVDASFLLIALVLVPLLVLWIVALFHILVRRRDLSVGRKAIWSVLVIVVPYIGLLIYAALRPPRSPTPTGGEDQTAAGSAIEELAQLVTAHEDGSITDEEFAHHKYAVFGLADPSD
jgi:hypothetical protein